MGPPSTILSCALAADAICSTNPKPGPHRCPAGTTWASRPACGARRQPSDNLLYQLLPAPPPPDEPPLLVLRPELELELLPELLPHEEELPEEARVAGLGRREITSLFFTSCWQKPHCSTRTPQPSAAVVAACATRSRPGARVR